ncbi:MAG TPA: J domain-containing protein [Verrucomicrobiae bacterium]|nr:J domain-containing protein [Verrucomicrobiae bacterium]
MKPDKLIWEARARIIWGESPSSVRNFLISNGISEMDADAKIGEFIFEKNAELKNDAVKEIFSGTILLIASGGVLLWIIFAGGLEHTYFFARIASILVFIGLYGVWKLINGLISLVQAQFKYQSSDNKQSDEFFDGNTETVAEKSSFHDMLGVSPSSSLKEIKTAYRNRIKMYHPDKFANQPPEVRQWADEMSKTINLAYEALVKGAKDQR